MFFCTKYILLVLGAISYSYSCNLFCKTNNRVKDGYNKRVKSGSSVVDKKLSNTRHVPDKFKNYLSQNSVSKFYRSEIIDQAIYAINIARQSKVLSKKLSDSADNVKNKNKNACYVVVDTRPNVITNIDKANLINISFALQNRPYNKDYADLLHNAAIRNLLDKSYLMMVGRDFGVQPDYNEAYKMVENRAKDSNMTYEQFMQKAEEQGINRNIFIEHVCMQQFAYNMIHGIMGFIKTSNDIVENEKRIHKQRQNECIYYFGKISCLNDNDEQKIKKYLNVLSDAQRNNYNILAISSDICTDVVNGFLKQYPQWALDKETQKTLNMKGENAVDCIKLRNGQKQIILFVGKERYTDASNKQYRYKIIETVIPNNISIVSSKDDREMQEKKITELYQTKTSDGFKSVCKKYGIGCHSRVVELGDENYEAYKYIDQQNKKGNTAIIPIQDDNNKKYFRAILIYGKEAVKLKEVSDDELKMQSLEKKAKTFIRIEIEKDKAIYNKCNVIKNS